MLNKGILRKKKDFTNIYKTGKSIPERYIVLFYKENDLLYNRIAFLASKKVGNSVQRNRAKRLMKESLRQSDRKIKEGFDIIIIARNAINGKSFWDVSKSLMSALKRGKLSI